MNKVRKTRAKNPLSLDGMDVSNGDFITMLIVISVLMVLGYGLMNLVLRLLVFFGD